jgi:hypothetical protein
MNQPDATYTNGRYELPSQARGVLVLADPPEAGWRILGPAGAEPCGRVSTPAAGGKAPGDRVTCGGH